MKIYQGDKIRNIAVLGHSGSGKTTLTEAALLASGVLSRMGRVEDGNTVSDYDQEEARRKVSISASLIPVEWKDTKINFIDTPGYFDFAGEVKQALRAADVALILISAKSGVEVGAEKAWEYAKEQNVPVMFFVNAMDDENADFDRAVEQLKEKFGAGVAPIQLPVKDGKFAGFVDVVTKEARKFAGGKTEKGDVPAALAAHTAEARHMLEEAVAETGDELMEKFFAEEPFDAGEIEKGLRDGLLNNIMSPVMCGAAVQNAGIAEFLDAIVAFVPPASEMCKKTVGKNPRTEADTEITCSDASPFSALVFKTIADPYVGRFSIFRVYSGILKNGVQVYNANNDLMEKVSTLFVLRGKEQIAVDELHTGDIGAIAKLAGTGTQDTLCTKESPIMLSGVTFPEALYSMGIMPKAKGDEDKISQALSKIVDEDKTLTYTINPETKQAVVSGLGDGHLDVLVNKLRNKFKLDVELVPSIVPYREMIKGKVKQQGKHKKQSGGHGQYGDVWIEFEPSGDLTAPYIFEEKVFGGSVPRNYFPAVEKGIQECVKTGPIAGYPVVGLKATLVDGSYHQVDSSEMAFKLATSIAFKEGFMKAKPVLLEPIAAVTVTVPDEYTGDIMGDMNKRRGRVLGMNMQNGKQSVSAEAPMSEMFKYALDLRSMTQGRGDFTMKFSRYDEAPADIAQKVMEARKKELEKDK